MDDIHDVGLRLKLKKRYKFSFLIGAIIVVVSIISSFVLTATIVDRRLELFEYRILNHVSQTVERQTELMTIMVNIMHQERKWLFRREDYDMIEFFQTTDDDISETITDTDMDDVDTD
jgi:hypothetical protein